MCALVNFLHFLSVLEYRLLLQVLSQFTGLSLKESQEKHSMSITRGSNLTLQRESVFTKNEVQVSLKMKCKSEQEIVLPSSASINVVFCKPGNIRKVMWLSDINPSPSFGQSLQLLYVPASDSEGSMKKWGFMGLPVQN